jgi:transporter family-2 protein
MNGHWQSRVGVSFTVLVNGVVVAALTAAFFLLTNQTPIARITSEIRPWIVLNGICGFTILTIAALTFPRIGAASVIVLMVAGQLTTALAFDHAGLLGLPQHPISPAKLAGVAFVVVGVFLTTRA